MNYFMLNIGLFAINALSAYVNIKRGGPLGNLFGALSLVACMAAIIMAHMAWKVWQ